LWLLLAGAVVKPLLFVVAVVVLGNSNGPLFRNNMRDTLYQANNQRFFVVLPKITQARRIVLGIVKFGSCGIGH
jgi:hypothetical protein